MATRKAQTMKANARDEKKLQTRKPRKQKYPQPSTSKET
jgi:hypothetical protein